jgi:hypothetical protein
MIDIFLIIGTCGGILVLLAYLLLALKKLKSHSIAYNALNFGGGLGLAISTFATKSWPSAILNVIWAAVAVYTILTIRKIKPVYKTLKVRE